MFDSDSYMQEMRCMLEEGQSIGMVLSGNSMVPFLVNQRDYIYVEPLPERIRKGDMCFFVRNLRKEQDSMGRQGFAEAPDAGRDLESKEAPDNGGESDSTNGPDTFIMHRVWKVDGDRYWFVGDAQPVIEGPVMREQIFGIVTKVRRKGKWITKGDLCWDFFEKIWIRMVPLRMPCLQLYGLLRQLKCR